jgi:hypothetical protein
MLRRLRWRNESGLLAGFGLDDRRPMSDKQQDRRHVPSAAHQSLYPTTAGNFPWGKTANPSR